MLKIYDSNKVLVDQLEGYENAKIDFEVSIHNILSFAVPVELAAKIVEEGYIGTREDGMYVIKEKDLSGDYYNIVAIYDLEELRGPVEAKAYITEDIPTIMTDLLPAGWTCVTSITKERTVTATATTILEVIKQVADTFFAEIKYDNINKIVYMDEEIGQDLGVYFHDQVNLKELTTDSDTYDFATRLIPRGFNGLGIESVNGGVSYLEDTTYSSKVITAYWTDERYTVAQNLMEDAAIKLAKLAKPYRSYSCSIEDLSRTAEIAILAYSIGDTITLVNKASGTKEKQRIVKITKYLAEPENDSAVIANRPRYIEDEQEAVVNGLSQSLTVTRASLMLLEDAVESKVSQTVYDAGIASVTDEIAAQEARITQNATAISQNATAISQKVSQTIYDAEMDVVSDNFTIVEQRMDGFENTIQIGGGSNLIKNSVGYGALNYWTLVSGDVGYDVSTWILEGIAKHGWRISTGVMSQEIDLIADKDYTLSGRLQKYTSAGTATIKLLNPEDDSLVYTPFEVVTPDLYNGEFSFAFNSGAHKKLKLVIDVDSASTTDPVELTDLMLAQGQNLDVWSQAAGENYTLLVKMDGKGIKVYRQDGTGYTIMDPNEFAGYYNNTKIFTLNGDITEVMGLDIGSKGLFIRPVKMVQTSTSLDIVWTGW
ncbi:MAG: phage tail protein [Youngiibacter sp.]|nr:phage tail protein [Youngiibacter sp.]